MNIKLKSAYEIGMYYTYKQKGIKDKEIESSITLLRLISDIGKKDRKK